MNEFDPQLNDIAVRVYFDRGKLKYFDGKRLISYDGRSDTARVESIADQCKTVMRWIMGIFAFVSSVSLAGVVASSMVQFQPSSITWWLGFAFPVGLFLFFLVGLFMKRGKIDEAIDRGFRGIDRDIDRDTMKKLRELYAQGPRASHVVYKPGFTTFVQQVLGILALSVCAGLFVFIPAMGLLGPVVAVQLKTADKQYLAGDYAQAEKTYKWILPLLEHLPLQISSQSQYDNLPYMWDRMAQVAAAGGRLDEARTFAKQSLDLHVYRFTVDPDDSHRFKKYNQYSEGVDALESATNYCELLAASNQKALAINVQKELWPKILPYYHNGDPLSKYERTLLRYVEGGLELRGFREEAQELKKQIDKASGLSEPNRTAWYMELLCSQKPMWREGEPVRLVPQTLR
jgi:hypothetical protein